MKKDNKHIKPTPEELQANIDKSLAEAEALKDEPKIVEPEPEPEPTPIPEPEPEPEVKVEPEPEPEPEVDLKKKLSASARENQKILAKNRKLNQAIDESNDIPEPTEEELIKEYPDWEIMSDTEKKLVTEAIISKKFRQRIVQAREEGKKIEKWNEEVDKFVEDPQALIDNPELEGKTEEFKVFATEESNNSVPFKILIGAFLHQNQTAKSKNKGQMFPTGSGGPNDRPQPKSDKLTVDQAAQLRKTDYAKFKEYLKAGKIDLESI